MPGGTWFLKRLGRLREEVDHLDQDLKGELGLEDIRPRGMEADRVHVFLVLIWRNLHVLYNWMEDPSGSLRRMVN